MKVLAIFIKLSFLMKPISKLLISLLALFIVSCSTEKQQAELDYSSIPLIELTKEFSITESEDYLPNQLQSVMVDEDGTILISQRNEKSIHQFDSSGNHVAKIVGPGRGPGELSQYANPHFKNDILYMSNNHGLISEYRKNEDGIYEHITDHNYRLPGPLIGIKSEDDFNEFFIQKDSIDYPFGEVPPEFTTDFILPVKVDADTLNVGEKVLSLRKHSSFIRLTNGGNTMTHSSLPYRYSDYMTETLPGGKILVQRPTKSAIQIYDENYDIEHEVILNVKDRPVTEADMDYHFSEQSRTEKRDRRELIQDIKPPFTTVLMDDDNRFWLQTDETEKGKEIVVLNYDGEPLGKLYIPANATIHEVKHGNVYIIQAPWGLPSIDIYSVDL